MSPTMLLLFFSSLLLSLSSSTAGLVKDPPLVLDYHNGTLLSGNISVNLIWYGKFSFVHRSMIVNFILSLNYPHAQSPSVASWWNMTAKYKGFSGMSPNLLVKNQTFDKNCSLGMSLNDTHIVYLASRGRDVNNTINVVLTAEDVAVDGFCMGRCGAHGSSSGLSSPFVYAWVGNSKRQCLGTCAWPFHKALKGAGPQSKPLVAPSGDVGVDGMAINLATVLAGAVTNPLGNGYFQGPATALAPLEAVSACTGAFGSGAYPGYPGKVLVDNNTGASYNANGMIGRKYLLPAMWDPQTSKCFTLV